jgi:integrase
MTSSIIRNRYGPDLVTLSAFIDDWRKDAIQNAITQIHNEGGNIFAPYEGDDRCAQYRTHDPEYEEKPKVPIDVDYVPPQNVVLTTQGIKAAQFTEKDFFEVGEFYSYHPSCWNEKYGFFIRLAPYPPIKIRLSEVLVTKERAESLKLPTRLPSVESGSSLRPCGLISEELAIYSEGKCTRNRWTDRTRADNENVFKTFVEIIGDKPVYSINQDDIEKYIRTLNTLPPNRMKHEDFKKLSAAQAASLNAERKGKAISNSSKNKYIERLSGPFEYFVGQKFCDYNFIHNTEGYKVTRADKLAARDPFSDDDLKQIFEGDHSIKLLKAKLYMPSRPWGLLIALFTGARASEIFSLTTKDIRKDGETLYFDIRDREGHNQLKSDAAVRGIPIHQTLLDLGFEKYLKRAKKAQPRTPLPLLFPDIVRSPQHGWARNTTRWYNEKLLPRIEVKEDKQKVYHSFRHTISDKFRRDWTANPLKVSSYLGHQDDYGKLPEWKKGYGSRFSPTELLEISDAIQFDIDLGKFKSEILDKLKPRRSKAKSQ